MVHAFIGILLGGVLLGGCGPKPQVAPAPSAPRPAARPLPPPLLDDGAWGELTSLRFAVRLPLPSAARWSVDDRREPWLVARDPATHSEVRLRAWRAPRRVAPADCEAEARASTPRLPRPQAEDVLDESKLETPSGLHTHRLSAARASPDGQTIEGYVLSFGAATGRCLALVYLTRDEGRGAAARVGARLAVAADEMFARAGFRTVDERGEELRPER